ncbi:MAG TPA: DNA cytosine methyltransferase [Planctomycetota bacterium]|nr:DNA cytosine methyltransferase [Planctomycetota bacterium]
MTLPPKVDIIVGGPPCPAFTRVGRAKLREIQQHPEAFLHDPRAKLYLEYLRFVRELKPVALLMENVPDVLNYGDEVVAEDICDTLEELGYVCAYTLLNAASYGVPQMRDHDNGHGLRRGTRVRDPWNIYHAGR